MALLIFSAKLLPWDLRLREVSVALRGLCAKPHDILMMGFKLPVWYEWSISRGERNKWMHLTSRIGPKAAGGKSGKGGKDPLQANDSWAGQQIPPAKAAGRSEPSGTHDCFDGTRSALNAMSCEQDASEAASRAEVLESTPAHMQHRLLSTLMQSEWSVLIKLEHELDAGGRHCAGSQGETGRGADLLAQRFKAVELSLHDGDWSRATHPELLPPNERHLTSREEKTLVAKELRDELRVKRFLQRQRGTPIRSPQRSVRRERGAERERSRDGKGDKEKDRKKGDGKRRGRK